MFALSAKTDFSRALRCTRKLTCEEKVRTERNVLEQRFLLQLLGVAADRIYTCTRVVVVNNDMGTSKVTWSAVP